MNLIKKAIAILIVLTVCLTPIMASADENVDNKKVKILMLGNSLFYANSMDTYIFPEFCKAAGKDVEITSITESGTTLYRLASSETSIGKKALTALESDVYDYVILNPSRRVTPFEYSVYHAEKQAALYLNSLINAMGAKTLLAAQPGVAVEDIPVYTMSESGIGSSSAYTLPMDRLTNQIYVENLCNDLCSEMKNAEVVRVGAAAETIISEFPDFNSLYNADNRHPSTRGSYLQAACYYAAIFKESPVGVNFVYSLIPMNAVTVQRAAAISVLNQDKSILKTEVANRVLSGKLVSNTSATLNWTEPKSADYYNIYRKDGHNSYVLIGRTVGKECSYTDKTLKGGNTYYYRVKPVHKIRDLVYESDYSNTVTVKTLGKVKVTSVKLNSAKSATIKFNSVDGAAKYRIYRKKTTGKSYSLIAKTKKTSFPITRELCDSILNGDTLPPAADASAAQQQVFLKEHLQLLRPRVIVDYERTAFVHPIGNVRITLDRNIAGSYRLNDFFNPDLMLIPVLEPHMHVLEVKYDELLPDFIAQAIEINTLRHTSFSKYYLCRQSSNLIYGF